MRECLISKLSHRLASFCKWICSATSLVFHPCRDGRGSLHYTDRERTMLLSLVCLLESSLQTQQKKTRSFPSRPSYKDFCSLTSSGRMNKASLESFHTEGSSSCQQMTRTNSFSCAD